MEKDRQGRTTKSKLWRELLWRKPITVTVILILFFSTVAYLWDDLLIPALPSLDRPRLYAIIHWLPWYIWTIAGLLLLVFFVGENAYRVIAKAEDEADRLRNPNLNFVVTHEDTPQTLNSGQIGIHRRIVVANDSDVMAVNCELAVENTSLALTGFTCNSALPVKDGNGARRANIHQRSTLHFDLFVTFLVFNTDVPQFTKMCTSTWPDLPISGESQETIDLRLAGDNISTRRFQIRARRKSRTVEIEEFRLQL